MPVQRYDAVLWDDTLRTEQGGRIRMGLLDGSILNVGSQSSLHIEQHDPKAQRTTLQLAYGRMRASVVRISQPGGGFVVRTPSAVAGVVGTRFYLNVLPDFTEAISLDGTVRVTGTAGEVLLHTDEYTRVGSDGVPTPPRPATPQELREAEEATDIPAAPLEWSRVEISWPPAGCGEGVSLMLRAWAKQMKDGKEIEAPIDSELISGRLTLSADTVYVEGGRATLAERAGNALPKASFMPSRGAKEVPTKVWEPKELAPGDGWRAPRAVFVGSAFYVQGPMGIGGRPQFSFGEQRAELLWAGPCGAGFLAPLGVGREYDVTLSLNGERVASGKMNLISIAYRTPQPPTVMKGQQSRFGVDISGLENLAQFTQGRPVMTTIVINQTPAVIGNLKSSTPGATASGETITYMIGGPTLRGGSAGGTVRLDGVGTARIAGTFVLGIDNKLDPALEQPRTPLAPIKP
ncbi:MAG TPA: FecR family protein [Candidatus Acidoferrales bacterium]|nr:FecR family protein [Candidatus Acidoferrales bacterium]